MGSANGNLWVWLECIGVFSGWCCKAVYRYPHNNYYFFLLHLYGYFLAAASLLLRSFLNVFSFFIYLYVHVVNLESLNFCTNNTRYLIVTH